jgi:OmcA/MtrC family decaheme c-type cytochrome
MGTISFTDYQANGEKEMKHLWTRWGMACLVVGAVAGCGGGGQSASPPPTPDELVSFAAVQEAGQPVVVVNGPPKVNFAVFSPNGALKTDLTLANVSFAIAKLVPGANGNPDQWVNYIYRKETATAGVGPGGVPALPSAMQATTDAKTSAALVYNADGYYTYTFTTDITNPAKTNGVVFEPGLTHRVAIQLSYTSAGGETIRVNPYFDFTLDVNGKSVPVTDPAKTRKMTDVASCNGCHDKLALHGGGRVDTQFCVMCHNPGTTDANSGNVLNLATMVHKIHAGKLLKSQLATGGEDYTIWGYQNSKHSYAEVGFPQDLRNCAVCHSGANPKTPQGDNWKTKPSQEACLTCHANNAGSKWDAVHSVVAGMRIGAGAPAKALTNADCADCHKVGSNISPERVHWNQNEENAAKYKMNIESVAFNDTADHKGRSVTVKYFLSDPTNGNAAYNLVTTECTAGPVCSSSTKFGNLRFYLAYQNMPGQPANMTEYSAYNNGGSSANAYAYKGVNDGSNHYTVNIPVPDDTALAVAKGTARVVSIGQIKERQLQVMAATDPRPEVVPTVLVNTVVQHTHKELALSGSLQPRRAIVANEKCNVCHGALGTTSGSNTLANAFHSGARNTVEACVTCHDANRASSTVMTNGLFMNESYQFKRMIHGIHGNSKRTYPFTHGNTVIGAFNKDGTSATGGLPLASTVENYAAEVAWPGVGINCNACHVNNSYKQDLGPLGVPVLSSSLSKNTLGDYTNANIGLFEVSGACIGKTGSVATKNLACTAVDVSLLPVISPKAATCTACHDSINAIGHVMSFGGASFGNKTQADMAGLPRETCDDCHASGGFKSVDFVHGQK